MATKKKYKHTETRQYEGDDGYCWAVFLKNNPVPVISGLTRSEVPYYRNKIEKSEEEKTSDDVAMRLRAVRALHATWNAIGYDCLQAYQDEESVGDITAEDVRECVSTCGFLTGYPDQYGNDKEAIAWLDAKSWEFQQEVLEDAFPNGRYGM